VVELLIMRHAKSDWSVGAPDFQRPLNDRGVRAADTMAEWLLDNELCPSRILSSSAERARSTAMAVMYGCAVDRRHVDFEDRLYHATATVWIDRLAHETAPRILICGHNPTFDDLVFDLASTEVPLSTSGKLMTTAAIAHLRFAGGWDELAAGSGELVSLTRPRDLD